MKFRLIARNFRLRKVPYEVACELVAFLHVVPLRHAKWIFQWNPRTVRRARFIWKHEGVQADALKSGMIEANMRAVSVDVGLALLAAMREGGWPGRGVLPDVVRMAIAERYHRQGRWSAAALGRELGVSANVVRNAEKARPLGF